MRPAPHELAAAPGSWPWLSRAPGRLALGLVVASLALHVALAGALALAPQEAYYWQYARHLDLSYFDHPPLAAWTIRATTGLFGDGERAVRLAATLHAALFALFFYRAGRRLFGPRAAALAVVAGLTTPILAIGQAIITPDAPLLSGWAAALYFTVRALDEERGPWLLAAGAAVGWATLGKYTGWLLAPQIFLALLLDPAGRRLLRGPWPWLALVLAAALFAPVVVWNARHGWASFGFQFGQRGADLDGFSFGRLARFLGLQGLAVTPLLFLGLLAAMGAALRRWRERPYRLCALFFFPAFAGFLAVSPFMWVKGNWLAPAWPAALLAAAALVQARAAALARPAAAALGVAVAGTAYLHLVMFVPWLPFPPQDDVITGWKELAVRVEAERARLSEPGFVLGCGYKPASELAYYLPGRPETYSQTAMREPGLQYDYWYDGRALEGREGILVLDRRDWRTCLRRDELCQPIQMLEPLVVRRHAQTVTTFDLWRCRFQAAGAGRSPT
jgi:4-amino-4-deoxy-L-arabinose transferase-like glycosyltransferase